MVPANFAYQAAGNDCAALPLVVSVFAERGHVLGEMRDDAVAAGFGVAACAGLAELGEEAEAQPLGDLVLVDCPVPDAAQFAALARLDLRMAHAGAQLIVSTSVEGLDAVFGCLDQSQPQILVDPTRADRVIALGRALARVPRLRVRELSEEDRLVLLRLTEQVGQIAQRLERLETPLRALEAGDADGVFRFESPKRRFAFAEEEPGDRLVRTARPALPDPRLVRRIVRQRQLRARFFDGDLFGDPAWDMLLDLTAARAEHNRVSVTSLCIASGVPPTTALRWIAQLTEAGLFQRVEDETDRRRAFIALTDRAADAMARYFAELGSPGPRGV